jgi:hypothetical protein
MTQHLLDCFCQTCDRKITLEEVRADFHKGHEFSPADNGALQAVKAYVARERSKASAG